MILLISNQPEIVAIPGFATMGAVLTARRPRNPIGWLSLAVALGAAVEGFALQYAVKALAIAPGSLPLGWFMAWLSQILGPVGTLPLALLLLLFPNGRLPSRRWRPLVWVLGLCAVFLTVGLALYPGSLDLATGGRSPLRSASRSRPGSSPRTWCSRFVHCLARVGGRAPGPVAPGNRANEPSKSHATGWDY